MYDLTQSLNYFVTIEKRRAEQILSHFDVEWSEDRKLVKHYPIDDSYAVGSEGELTDKIENISRALWTTLTYRVEEAFGSEIIVAPKYGVLSACEWGSSKQDEPKKLGKIYTCRPHRFNTVNKPIDVVQPFLYTYVDETGQNNRLSGEINFGIEIY